MKKRMTALLLALLLCLVLRPAAAAAEEDLDITLVEPEDEIPIELIDDDEIRIDGGEPARDGRALVIFRSNAPQLLLSVYRVEDGRLTTVEPLADGGYRLEPGSYRYFAYSTGYVSAENVPFTVPEDPPATMEISVLLERESAGEQIAIHLGDSNMSSIYGFLVNNLGLNEAAACGVMANIQCESGFRPQVYGDNGTSYGICQWHNERFEELKNYCLAMGYDYSSLEGQLRYLEYTLSGHYAALYGKLLAGNNNDEGAYEAGYAWCWEYERPANFESVSVLRGNLARDGYWPIYGARAYVNQCERYAAYVTLELRRESAVWSQPCTDETNGESRMLCPLYRWDMLTAVALYRNPEGEYWYRVRTADGDGAYVPAADAAACEILGEIRCGAEKFPEQLEEGDTYSCDWLVSSGFLELDSVEGQISRGGTEEAVMGPARMENLAATACYLRYGPIDRELVFSRLKAGTYRITIRAEAINRYVDGAGQLQELRLADTPIDFAFRITEKEKAK